MDQTASPTSSERPAGFGLRALAKLTDLLVLSIVVLCFRAFGKTLLASGYSETQSGAFLLAGSLVFYLLYFSCLTSGGRQTLGYKLAGLKVITTEGKPLSWTRGFVRGLLNTLGTIGLSIFIGWIDYLPIALTKSKRAVHDIATNTRVVSTATANYPLLVLLSLVYLFSFLFVVRRGVSQIYYIPSGAMEPTLAVGDKIYGDKLDYRLHDPKIDDVVVFRAPAAALGNSGSPGEEVDFIKRCIGVPGDVVYTKVRGLYRNGKLVKEPYTKWSPYQTGLRYAYDMKIVDGKIYSREYEAPDVPGLWQTVDENNVDQEHIDKAAPGKVPAGQYIMLGDHRNNSNDSHVWGFVARDLVIARAAFIFWPPERRHKL